MTFQCGEHLKATNLRTCAVSCIMEPEMGFQSSSSCGYDHTTEPHHTMLYHDQHHGGGYDPQQKDQGH